MKLDRTAERVVRALLVARGRSLDIWQLSRLSGYLPDVISSVEWLKKIEAVKTKDTLVCLRKTDMLPKYVLKKGYAMKEVMQKYLYYRKQASFDTVAYDQLAVLPAGIKGKLSLLLKRNDLAGRDVICIGDDDLFSVGCSLTGLPKSITVLDIDKRVIDFIRKISKKLPVPIRAIHSNLLNPLPNIHDSSFDVCITEPPDTVRGMALFVSRGIQTLRKEGTLYCGMTSTTLHKRQWLEIERIIITAGAVFTDIVANCSEYGLDKRGELVWKGFEKLPGWINKPATGPWFVSTLFRCELVGEKKTIKVSSKNTKDELITSLLP